MRFFQFRALLALTLFAVSFSAHAAPKKLMDLFPVDIANIDAAHKVFSRDSPEYGKFMQCQNATDKAANCEANGLARFYNFSLTNGVDDTFDFLNRCVGMRGFLRYPKDVKNGVPTGNVLSVTADTVDCTGLEPDEVISAQLALCYTRASGAYCSLATACFEGTKMKGQCTKDYVAETIYVSSRTGGAPAAPTPTGGPLVDKCNVTYCHIGRVYTATCYANGTNSGGVMSATPCGPQEDTGNVSMLCNDPTFCSAAGPVIRQCYYSRSMNFTNASNGMFCSRTPDPVTETPEGVCSSIADCNLPATQVININVDFNPGGGICDEVLHRTPTSCR